VTSPPSAEAAPPRRPDDVPLRSPRGLASRVHVRHPRDVPPT